MRHRPGSALGLAALVLVAAACAGAAGSERLAPAAPDRERIRSAAALALPYLDRDAEVWMAGNAPQQSSACNSCHVVTFGVWARAAAARHGVGADDDGSILAMKTWSLEHAESAEETGQLLLAIAAAPGRVPAERAQQIDALVEGIRRHRNDAGTWTAAGQLPFQKRPAGETDGTSTMWSVFALDAAGSPLELDR